jgi:Fe2+ transport system protein FeoA
MIHGMIPLTQARAGTPYLVQSIAERSAQTDRLREIGLIERAPISLLKSDRNGVIICLKGARLALSNSLAEKVMVRTLAVRD